MERLSAVEGRVAASLVEKQLLTPQAYPLTLHALTAACNQSTSRDPVMRLTDDEVEKALDALKEMRLVRFVLPSHGRSVVRYRHVLDESLGIDTPQLAVLAVLELRGPQTLGELRARTERMARIDSVEHDLALLADAAPALAERLERRPGQKEERWRSLLGGEAATGTAPTGTAPTGTAPTGPDSTASFREGGAAHGPAGSSEREAPDAASATSSPPASPGARETGALQAAVDELRRDVAALRAELDELRDSLGG